VTRRRARSAGPSRAVVEHRDEVALPRTTDRDLSAEAAVLASIAAFATAEVLTGLSPASLRPIND